MLTKNVGSLRSIIYYEHLIESNPLNHTPNIHSLVKFEKLTEI